jgi:hypothetical protein
VRVSGGRQEVGVQCWLQTNERKIAMEVFIVGAGVESSFEFSGVPATTSNLLEATWENRLCRCSRRIVFLFI